METPGNARGRRLQLLIQRSGLSKAALARVADVSRQAIYDAMARGTASEDVATRLARALSVSPEELFEPGVGTDDRTSVRVQQIEPYSPNPRSRKRLPPGAYARVYEYLVQLEAAGASHEQLDEAERVMVDGAYNKLNTRDVHVRTEEEMVGDIDMAWAFIRGVLRHGGINLK